MTFADPLKVLLERIDGRSRGLPDRPTPQIEGKAEAAPAIAQANPRGRE
jgi:hypothetical protein